MGDSADVLTVRPQSAIHRNGMSGVQSYNVSGRRRLAFLWACDAITAHNKSAPPADRRDIVRLDRVFPCCADARA